MREYELLYITRQDLDPEQQEGLQQRVSDLIKSGGGEITGVDIWGRRRLGYPIQHETEGYYVVLTFKGEEEMVRELDRVLSITDEFLRFKIVRIDHHK